MALFMVTTRSLPRRWRCRIILTEGRREREDQLIWRGQQYVRAIRLYYRKTGHYPSNLDDLKKGMPELHFLRYAAYKDPMKKDDGAWRFIYVNAAGQIIGSTKYATLQQMAILDMNGGKIPGVKKEGDDSGQPGVPASSLADQSNNLNSSNPPGSDNNANSSNASNSSSQNPSTSTTPPGSVGASPDNSQNAGVGSGAPNSTSNPNSASPNPNSTATSPGASPSPTNAAGTPAGGPGGINTNMNNQSMAALAALKPLGPWMVQFSADSLQASPAAWISLRFASTTAEKNISTGNSSGILSKTRPRLFSRESPILPAPQPGSPGRLSAADPPAPAFSATAPAQPPAPWAAQIRRVHRPRPAPIPLRRIPPRSKIAALFSSVIPKRAVCAIRSGSCREPRDLSSCANFARTLFTCHPERSVLTRPKDAEVKSRDLLFTLY